MLDPRDLIDAPPIALLGDSQRDLTAKIRVVDRPLPVSAKVPHLDSFGAEKAIESP